MQHISISENFIIQTHLEKRNDKSIIYHYAPWLTLLLCAAFSFYKFILQIFPGVMATTLMQVFHVNGVGLGNLAATYFYAYLITQLFAGPLLDQYSPRLITALAISICAFGTLLFSKANTLLTAEIARILIGLGASFATVSYMKMTSLWFKPNQMSLADGLLSTAAMTGALCGQMPLAYLMENHGWQNSLLYCSLAGVVLTITFLLLVRDNPASIALNHPENKNKASIKLKELLMLLKKPENGLLTFYSGLIFTPIAVLGGLWGNPFFIETYHVNPATAALFTSFIFVGLALGGPIFGILADRFGRIKIMECGTVIAFISLLGVIYIYLPAALLCILLFTLGFGAGAFMSCFPLGKEFNDIKFTATVISLVNTGDALFGSFTEPLIGKMLDATWSGQIINGIHHFTATNFKYAFSILPLYMAGAYICLIILKKYRSHYAK